MFGPTSGQQQQRPNNPQIQHKRALRRPGFLYSAAIAIFCAAYALGYLPQSGSQFGSFFDAVVHISPPDNGSNAINPTVYGIGGFIAFLLLLGLLRSFDLLFRRLRGDSTLGTRQPKSIDEFIHECGQEWDPNLRDTDGHQGRSRPAPAGVEVSPGASIGARTAREGHLLLQHYYPKPKCIELGDDLRRDLRLSAENIQALRLALLTRCERRDPPNFDLAAIATVYDLLQHAECAPSQRATFPGLPTPRLDSRSLKSGTGTPTLPRTEPPAPIDVRDAAAPQQLYPHAGSKAGKLADLPRANDSCPHPHTITPSAPELRHPAILEVHAVAMTHDARARLRPHFSGIRRRSGEHRIDHDYAGPWRRATDRPRPAPAERPATPFSAPASVPPPASPTASGDGHGIA